MRPACNRYKRRPRKLPPVSRTACLGTAGTSLPVYANSGPQMDTIYRPTPMGAAIVLNLRGESSLINIRWTLLLSQASRLSSSLGRPGNRGYDRSGSALM